MGVDEDGGDIFVPSELEEEHHEVTFTENFSQKKTKRYVWFVVFGFGVLIFLILVALAIALVIEFTILKKEGELPPIVNKTTSNYMTSQPSTVVTASVSPSTMGTGTPTTLMPSTVVTASISPSTLGTATGTPVSTTLMPSTVVTASVSPSTLGTATGTPVSTTSMPMPNLNSTLDLEWWKTTVIYQCYPRSYQDSDGDGSGDLAGIISRVGYLNSLGIKVLWLNPIFKSPQRDNGYDISNYTDIDPLFGNLDLLKQLLDELHQRGMHLLLDFVPNHTSDEHPWFVESRQNKTSPKRSWYVWADGENGGSSPPNNWISVFGGSAWTKCNITGQYYLHQFSEFQPDLNYSNPEVVEAFKNVLRFWLDLGVDGFRIDAVAHLLEDPQLRDEPINSNHNPDCDTDCYDYLNHTYTRNYMGIHDVIRGWRQVLDSYSATRKRFMVGEAYESVETIMTYYGQNLDEFHYPFNFFLLTNSNWTGTEVNRLVNNWLSHMPVGGWPNWVLGNHDNHRIASKAPYYLARALNVLLLTLPGTPTTYYGEEILMIDVDVPDSQRQDCYGDRDKERTPMQWTSGPHANFTTSNSSWLPIAANYTTVNVEVETTDTTSMLTLYRDLVALRSNSAFRNTNYDAIASTTEVLAYVRRSDSADQQYLVVVNFSSGTVSGIDLSSAAGFPASSQIYLSTVAGRSGSVSLSSVSLAAGEALILQG